MISTDQVAAVMGALRRARLPMGREDDAQVRIGEVLTAAAIPFMREHRLTPADRPDFWLDGLVIEVKLRAVRMAVLRQLVRYAIHPDTKAILLVTGTAMGLPPEIEGKPAYYLSIGATWL